MHTLSLGILLILVTSLPVAAATPSATSPPAALDRSAPLYLALGDSLAYGSGASEPDRNGYVPLVHSFLRETMPCHAKVDGPCPELQLLNLAENGATTESLMKTQMPAALELLEERNSDHIPDNDITTITLDIGGNDTFGSLVNVCATGVSALCAEAVQVTFDVVDENLRDILMQLREAGGEETRIVVMTYFNSLIACDFRDAADNADLILEGVAGVSVGLNNIIRQTAHEADSSVAETYGLIEESDLVGGRDCLHTNDEGHRKIAAAFASVIRDLSDFRPEGRALLRALETAYPTPGARLRG